MSIRLNQSHVLGLPRIGANREMKKAVESYWRKELSLAELQQIGQRIEDTNWQMQADAGLDFITVGDFSWYDHVLDHSALLGVIPERFKVENRKIDLNTLFCMARGQAPDVQETTACEMTKWFNTNYHYIVPEFNSQQDFQLSTDYLFSAIDRALAKDYRVKPVLLGPLSYLWLGNGDERSRGGLIRFDSKRPARCANGLRCDGSDSRERHPRVPSGRNAGAGQILKFAKSRGAEKCNRVGLARRKWPRGETRQPIPAPQSCRQSLPSRLHQPCAASTATPRSRGRFSAAARSSRRSPARASLRVPRR